MAVGRVLERVLDREGDGAAVAFAAEDACLFRHAPGASSRSTARTLMAGRGRDPPVAELSIESPWAADERAVSFIKSQEAVRLTRDADPFALPDLARFEVAASEP